MYQCFWRMSIVFSCVCVSEVNVVSVSARLAVVVVVVVAIEWSHVDSGNLQQN